MNAMYRNILFAIDADPGSDAALPFVTLLAQVCGAEVHLLHVHNHHAQSGTDRQLLKRVHGELEAGGLTVGGEVRVLRDGGVADAIAKVAMNSQADLVAIGSHARSDLGSLFHGSVSNTVARRLRLPVLVVAAGSRPRQRIHRILVAVDGSEASWQALDTALQLARLSGGVIDIVHVEQILLTEMPAIVETLDEAERLLTEALERVSGNGVEARGVLRSGTDVATQISEEAQALDADLVILASRRPSPASALIWGSVAHRIIHCARRPVLLTRPVQSSSQTTEI